MSQLRVGAGRIDVSKAARAGLLMNETRERMEAAYASADRNDISTLNTPSLADQACDEAVCQWSRELTSTLPHDGSWEISANTLSDGLRISLNLDAFTLSPGESATIEVIADASALPTRSWGHFTINIKEINGLAPDISIPGVAMRPIESLAVSDITRNSARLNGRITFDMFREYWHEWGRFDDGLTEATARVALSDDDDATVEISQELQGLECGSVYQYRLMMEQWNVRRASDGRLFDSRG
jgi:hypothetical protein